MKYLPLLVGLLVACTSPTDPTAVPGGTIVTDHAPVSFRLGCGFGHNSGRACQWAFLTATSSSALAYAACSRGMSAGCYAALVNAAHQWDTWGQTPDAFGHRNLFDCGGCTDEGLGWYPGEYWLRMPSGGTP